MSNFVASHVIDPSKKITTPSGVDKAVKARRTMATAREILIVSGQTHSAAVVGNVIDQIAERIREYYNSDHYRNRWSTQID